MKASKPVRYLCRAVFALTTVSAAGMPAFGQGIPGYADDPRYAYDAREIALLPRYCIYTQLFRDNVPGGNNADEIKRWALIMGESFSNMHHYCWGLMYTNRALLLAHSQQLRAHYLGSGVREYDYVIIRAQPGFMLLPEILTKKGENLIRLDKGQEAMWEFERATTLKPDYWPPYAAMSDYYRKIGDLAKAREWLETGLSVTPDVNALKRRMAEIDAAKDNRTTSPQRPERQSAPQSSVEKSAAQLVEPKSPAER